MTKSIRTKRPYAAPDTTSYIFHVRLAHEEDGRWSAWIEALPGCATWGHSQEEALRNIHDAATAYLRDMQETGEDIPTDPTLQIAKHPIIAVTL